MSQQKGKVEVKDTGGLATHDMLAEWATYNGSLLLRS